MASCNLNPREWKNSRNLTPINEKFERVKACFDLLAVIEIVAGHPKFNPGFYTESEFREITLNLKFFAQDSVDLYSNQKTDYLDYNDQSFTRLIDQADRLIGVSGLPNTEKSIFIRRISKISENFTKIQNGDISSLYQA